MPAYILYFMKKNIAIVAGGFSGEYIISEKSAAMIRKNLDPDLFNAYIVFITHERWFCMLDNRMELPVNKNDFSVMVNGESLVFDCAFITVHGSPGEDGKLQGYFDMLGIPYTTSGLLPAALTFNKYFCNLLAAQFGVKVARSVKLSRNSLYRPGDLLKTFSLPVFVKPNKGGSSLGNSLVTEAQALATAIDLALEHDNEVLVEEYISGQELTCGVFRRDGKVLALPVTAITSKSGANFFDFRAKYTKEAAEEITPAPIPAALTKLVRETTAMLYEKFEMKGMARMDYIYSGDSLYFLEINVTPGMAETSIVPQQAAIEGISVRELFTAVILEAMA